MDEDGEVTISLPLKQWRLVAAHVEGGIYRDVQPILLALYAQVNGQIQAANEQAAAAIAAEIAAAQAVRPPIQEGTDDSAEHPQALSHSPALH